MDFDTQTFKKCFSDYMGEVIMGPMMGGPAPSSKRLEELQKEIDNNMKTVDDILARNKGDFLLGDHLTLADLCIFTSTFYAFTMGKASKKTHSRASKWWDRVAEHPSVSTLFNAHKEAVAAWMGSTKK